MRTEFEEVAIFGRKSSKCRCGKRRTRSAKFFQTLNPWNKNKDGNPKTANEIIAELVVERAEWMKAPIVCDNCPPGPTRKEGK